VLALFGERDLQVPALINRERFAALRLDTLRAPRCGDRAEILPGANHLFQQARSGSPAEYGKLQQAFVDGLPETIAAWIAGANAGGDTGGGNPRN
jgi:hypothetical protein